MKPKVLFAAVFAALCCAVLTFPQIASANMGVAQWDRTSVVGAGRGLPTGVEVEKEELVFRCDIRGTKVLCDFEATYFLVNPQGRAETVVGAFFSEGSVDVEIELDGEDAGRRLSVEEFRAVEERVFSTLASDKTGVQERRQLETAGYPEWIIALRDHQTRGDAAEAKRLLEENLEDLPGYGFEIGAKERKTLVAKGRVEPGEIKSFYGVFHAVKARHLLMGGVPEGREFAFRYLLSPLETWADVHRVEVIFEYPESLEFDLGGMALDEMSWNPRQMGTDLFQGIPTPLPDEDGTIRQNWSCEGDACEKNAPDTLYFSFTVEEPLIVNGGVSLRLGGRFGTGDSRFVGGLGYEICIATWALFGVTAETDFTRDVTIVPTLSLATPWIWLVIPSLSAGAGVPVQIDFDGNTNVGIRLQIDMMFGPVGLVFPFDMYPGRYPHDPGRFQFGVMAQVGM